MLFEPDWPLPAGVRTVLTDRLGGHSEGVYAGFNLALHVDDDAAAVAANRQYLLQACPGLTAIQWLQQVHGNQLIEAVDTAACPQADGSITDRPGLAVAVLTADCLPVLICDREGRQVAAVHAGWRGLVAGVLDNAVAAFTASARDLRVYFGPAISQSYFEVGKEVMDQFISAFGPMAAASFRPAERQGYHYADLYALARTRLQALGVVEFFGGELCSYADSQRFYSYRRDGVTGRMASLIYIHP